MRTIFIALSACMVFSVAAQPSGTVPSEVGAMVFSRASPSVFVIRSRTSAGTAQGSGVAYCYGYDRSGKPDSTWIATNAYVILGGASIVVELGGVSRAGSVEYADSDLDIALVVVTGEVLPIARLLAEQEQVAVGSRVFAIGSPLGLENTISEGLLSGVRELKGTRVIQTSAAISKGNSGGGLFDSQGRFLGVTTYKLKGGENLNFAVDSRYIKIIDEALLASNLIRAVYERKVVRPGDENDLDEKYIESPALTRWLLDQKAPNGAPLHAYVNLTFEQTFRSGKLFAPGHEDFDSMLKKFLRGRPNSVQVSQSSSREESTPGTYRLSCPMYGRRDGSFQYDFNLRVDPIASSVNGRPAKFTDSEITFTTGKENAFIAVLNRYSARVAISSEQFSPLLTGTCVKVAERQF